MIKYFVHENIACGQITIKKNSITEVKQGFGKPGTVHNLLQRQIRFISK